MEKPQKACLLLCLARFAHSLVSSAFPDGELLSEHPRVGEGSKEKTLQRAGAERFAHSVILMAKPTEMEACRPSLLSYHIMRSDCFPRSYKDY